MPVESDAVSRRCIVNTDGCTLINKCEECKKEIAKLIEVDEMFIDYFKQLEYLKQLAEDKAQCKKHGCCKS
jgi:hypothetical protein